MFVFALLTASAADDPQLTARYRETMMKGVGAHMGQIGLVLKGKIDRPGDLLANAQAIEAAAMKFQELFPEGTSPDAVKTHALASVWKQPEDFKKANENWLAASKGLVAVLQEKKFDQEKAKEAWGKLGKACGGCHDTFKEDDH